VTLRTSCLCLSQGVGVGFPTPIGVGVGFFHLTLTPAVQLNHFVHCTPKLRILTSACWNGTVCFEIFMKLRILAVYHDFHWLLLATKFLTAELHSSYAKKSESEILERSESEFESDILSPTPQPWCILGEWCRLGLFAWTPNTEMLPYNETL